MPVTPLIRPATAEDVPAAVRTLTHAFVDYPFTRHVIAAEEHEDRVRRFQELFLVHIGMPYGRVWVTDAVDAVAVWTTPDQDPTPGFAEIQPVLTDLSGDRAPAFAAAEKALQPHRPQEPAWFLATVGVDPGSQGRGLGSAVIRPGLQAAEQAGALAFLETSAAGNVRFYQRLGFAVTADVELPDGGPRTWCMSRPAHRSEPEPS